MANDIKSRNNCDIPNIVLNRVHDRVTVLQLTNIGLVYGNLLDSKIYLYTALIILKL